LLLLLHFPNDDDDEFEGGCNVQTTSNIFSGSRFAFCPLFCRCCLPIDPTLPIACCVCGVNENL